MYNSPLSLCPPMRRVILGRDLEGNLSGSKGVTMDNFPISVKGWWKMTISHLKHSYLNWRVNPCKRKRLQFFIFFQIFFEFGFFFLFSFGLNRIFKCMTWQSIFLFILLFIHFFSLFLNGLLWAMSPVVDDLPAWSIFFHMRIVLKGFVF